MRRIIVNSTPIITLCNVGLIDILHKLYGEIVIPQAVLEEVTAKKDSACTQILNNLGWIRVEAIKDIKAKRMYQAKLHAGEVEVMILAQEEPFADLVIIDDNAAKKTAKYLGIKVIGTLGILVKAKQLGLVPSVREVLEHIKKNGFFISPKVEKIVLVSANEL